MPSDGAIVDGARTLTEPVLSIRVKTDTLDTPIGLQTTPLTLTILSAYR
ncbi:MAG: hypothetical protein IKP04_05240 [Candidatus Methanomethylophilaceae archaeon]|nr:hypothetical protein [Candidatus Methanomethylophilaceae archaeon]